jgi:hypothetical protein
VYHNIKLTVLINRNVDCKGGKGTVRIRRRRLCHSAWTDNDLLTRASLVRLSSGAANVNYPLRKKECFFNPSTLKSLS